MIALAQTQRLDTLGLAAGPGRFPTPPNAAGVFHFVPPTDADAVANDRFDARLRRADLAVIHQPSPCPSDVRKVAHSRPVVTRKRIENIR
jgi:hypothetical protein